MKPRILILTDFYLPGYKSGGAVRTLVNMIERMRDEFEFTVITRNHDGWGDFEPYRGIKTRDWNSVENVRVFYFGKEGISQAQLKKLWLEIKPEAVFLVSFFSSLTTKALIMRRLKQLPNVPFILAPQGELSAGALNIKSNKKHLFLTLTKNLGIYRKLIWKASGDEEKSDIKRVFGNSAVIEVVPDLTPRIILPEYDFEQKPEKKAGELCLIFLSRINRKKNLSFALQSLQEIKGTIVFDVYGAHDDSNYWRECQELIEKLPLNVNITIHGSIDYALVAATMSRYHFFILPTLNENFGHVVLEAMAAGCPVLLSDKTPWRNLSLDYVGWDLPLEEMENWRKILQKCVMMSADEFAAMSEQARKFALKWLAAPQIEAANRELLRKSLTKTN
ncbi:MAG: glycosyltransferase family 4 protein [Pyrinomonadaceae bacterium]